MCKRVILSGCVLVWVSGMTPFQTSENQPGGVQPGFPQQAPVQPGQQSAQIPGMQVPERWEEVQSVAQGIDEGRGDWYVKRKLLRKARQVDEQMRKRVQDVDEIQKQLIEKYGPQEKRFITALAELPTKMADITAALTKVDESRRRDQTKNGAGCSRN